jgi:hypothetical protein
MKLKLDDSVSSPQDLQALIGEVREYARWFSHNAVKRQLHAKSTTEQPELSPGAEALLRSWGAGTPLSQKSLDTLIAALVDFAASAPVVTITLAAPVSGSLKKSLVAWCRQNIAPVVLVNFQFNATLLGGMVVRYASHIFDWSFRRQILDNRAAFPEVLRRV